MPVSVRFVGSGDSFGSGGRFQTCILVDGGTDAMAQMGQGADLVIAECYYYAKPVTWHLNYPADRRAPERAWCEARDSDAHERRHARARDSVPEECARDGMVVELE
jgi:hypothetical protein